MLELNQLYNMDCMDGMKRIDDNSIDLIVTSPPFNIGNNHHTGSKRFTAYEDDMPESEYQKWQIDLLNECYRVLSPNGSMWYQHKNRIRNGQQITPYEWLLKCSFIIKQEVVWFNGSQNFDKCRFYPMTERVYWLTKNTNTKMLNTINHHDLFEWSAVGTNTEHKRAFPEQLVKDIALCFPNAKTILDPFMGSGTTAVVAYELGKDYIGFELDKYYYELAQKRIADNKAQLRFEL